MAIALDIHGKSEAFIRGYLNQAARYDKKNCTPGKTIQCGNVCRKPENCKKPSEASSAKSSKKQSAKPKEVKEFSSKIKEQTAAFNEAELKPPRIADTYGTDALDVKLGQVLRIPQKFIKTKKSGMSSQQIDAIAAEMKKRGKNITPVIIKRTGEDKYEAVQNGQIIEAARKAKLDFVWTIVADDDMLRQMAIESGLN
ncbi:MAG TPA: hypothetical protein V6C63_13725 [Allocoleopsis sp.]